MRLAAKLILLFLCGLLLIVAVFSYATLRREREIAIDQHERYAAELAAVMAERGGMEQAVSIPPVLASRQIRVRRVELRSTDDSRQPSVPRERLFVSQEITTITVPESGGNDRWYTYVPIASPENGSPSESSERLEISATDVGSQDRRRRMLVSSLLTLLCVSGLSAMVVYFGGVRMVGRPLNRLIDKVNRVSQGDLDEPVRIDSHDELGDLGRAINTMCDRLSLQREKIEAETAARIDAVRQLRHADRLRSVGRMAAGIAHEIGTPLNVVSGRAELIASGDLSDQATIQSAIAIKTESDRIGHTIRSLLDFARERPTHRERVDLRSIVETTLELLGPIAAKSGANLNADLPDHAVIANVDRGQIQQVLTNLVNNAIQSGDAGVEVRIGFEETGARAGDGVVLSVCDNGEGISADAIDHIFEPFFTTKDVGKGTGLGLAIAHGIVEEHGGRITVESEPGRGTRFNLMLPTGSAGQDQSRLGDPL
jgi:signal transduction histidine kinase